MSGDELERLSQAIALADGFQLLVLECHDLDAWDLHRLFDAVQTRVAALRGVPPLVLVYDPHVTTRESGSLRDEAWVRGVLGAILRVPATDTEEASVVAVIDGTGFDEADADSRELLSWEFLFHRMNERRNAVSRTLRGTLALALPPALVRVFLEEAPDVASIRSDMIGLNPSHVPASPGRPQLTRRMGYAPELLREAALRRLAADPRLESSARDNARRALAPASQHEESPPAAHDPARQALLELLLSLFSVDELHRITVYQFGTELGAQLPMQAPAASVALALITSLERRGLLDDNFFALLRRERPRRTPEIDRVQQLHGGPSARPLVTSSWRWTPSPEELHLALLELPRAQVHQAVQLAEDERVSAPLTRSGAAHARTVQRARMSVRDIVNQAANQGPDALQRLADALETLGYQPRA